MPQVARPASDISVGGWSKDTGATANLFQAIDEAAASDTDYVQSDLGTDGDAYVFGLGPLTDPGINTGHTINLRQRKDSSVGDTTDLDVIVQAGDFDIHTENYDDIDQTINPVSITLTADEVAEFRAHGGYADPRIKVVRRKRYSMTTNADLTYRTSPVTLQGDLRRPASGGPFPVVLYTQNSGWQSSLRTSIPSTDLLTRLAQEEGMASFIISMRVGPADLSPDPLDDCALALQWIIANAATYNLDANRIATMGGSGGGHMAMFLGSKTLVPSGDWSRLKCVVNASGPADLPGFPADEFPATSGAGRITNNLVGATYAVDPAGWEYNSPYYQIRSEFAPTFLAYSVDDSVPHAQGARMAAGLTAAAIPNRMLSPAGTNHAEAVLALPEVWSEAVTWLHRYLG